jgi:glutathionylspermidine synthase
MRMPWSAGRPLAPKEWDAVRMQVIFDCCKWDIQSEDQSVLADFPLFIEEDEWRTLAKLAEKLTGEVLDAEQELILRADLHPRLGLPDTIRKVLRRCSPESFPKGSARVMRFDFHFAPEGWRISEVNADVPGGFIEASGFTELMAPYYPSFSAPPNPAIAYAEKIGRAAGENRLIGFVHATAHSDDRQVMQYLAQEIQRRGMRAAVLSPGHLVWESNLAKIKSLFATGTPGLLIRFFPAEWLPNLRPDSLWKPWFCGGRTPMSNPGSAILIQSKRFPLVWDELATSMSTWRSLMPETRCPSELSAASQTEWVFKPVFGRVGEDVAIAGITEERAYREIVKDVRRHPINWAAERRFEAVAVQTESGPRYACLGIFTLDGHAVGAYGRIAKKPLIDQNAQDIAVLIRAKDNRDDDGKAVV